MEQKDVKTIELVGKTQDGDEVYHVVSKGGLHKMLKKTKRGDFNTLGQGNHRAVARVLANQLEKNIGWFPSLFKSDDMSFIKQFELDNKIIPDSTPSNHISQAVWNANASKVDDPMLKLYYTSKSLSHFQAAGLDMSNSLIKLNDTLSKLNKSVSMDKPFDEELLIISYEKKNNKPFPSSGI